MEALDQQREVGQLPVDAVSSGPVSSIGKPQTSATRRGKAVVREVIESILLRHEARRWAA